MTSAQHASSGPWTDDTIGSFSDSGPWVVDPAAMPWRQGVEELRTQTQRSVPDLVRRRRVPPARAAHVGASIGVTIARWLLRAGRHRTEPAAQRRLAESLRRTFERLGPTYLKLGQLIASAEGLLPAELVEEFKLCRDRVSPDPFSVVRLVLEEELERPLEQVFADIEPVPLAAASIAQVHRARLLTGQEVVVKVQRTQVRELVVKDIAAMSWLIPVLERLIHALKIANLPAYAELLAETLMEELDFRLEAQNMLDVAAVLAGGESRPVVVPRPHPHLVTKRMLVMEYMEGFSIDCDEEMVEAGVDPRLVFRALMTSFFEGAMVHGVFHGDLHGGNMLVLPDGKVALFDFGITGRLSAEGRQSLLGLMTAAAEDDEIPELRYLAEMGAFPPGTDLERLTVELAAMGFTKAQQAELSPDQLAKHMQRLMSELVRRGARLPKELFLYLKGMLYLNGATAALAAEIDLIEEMSLIFENVMTAHPAQDGIGFDKAAFQASMRKQYGTDAESLTHREILELQGAQQRDRRTVKR